MNEPAQEHSCDRGEPELQRTPRRGREQTGMRGCSLGQRPPTTWTLGLAMSLCVQWLTGEPNPAGLPVQEPAAGVQAVSIGMIQTATLNAELPLFVPTHPRVTSTLRFPGPIGAPEGRGFTEDEAKTPGEYLVSWTPGENHLTVTPLAGASALNLNVPFRGETYVVYFYPVERQFQALASLRLVSGVAKLRQVSPVLQNEKSLGIGELGGTRLLGLLDKIKLLRAVSPGKGQSQLAATLGLELNCPTAAATPRAKDETGRAETLAIEITHVVRDPCLGALAFALRLKNTSTQALSLAGRRFHAYCGTSEFQQRLGEMPAILSAGEEAEAFVAIETEALCPLRAENHWRLTAETVNPTKAGALRPAEEPALQAEAWAEKAKVP